jgi:hypothetical protein
MVWARRDPALYFTSETEAASVDAACRVALWKYKANEATAPNSPFSGGMIIVLP